jgi:murein DD-endopeptidase MepM/ murein hydrolase activator NlpD
MADREIRLIGSFQDDITPKLNKLNRQLLGTIKQFEKLQGKIAPVAAEMAKFNTAAAATSGNLKTQRSAIEENIRMLRQYRTELSRTANAQSRMGRGGMPRPPRGGGGGGGPIPPLAGGRGAPRGGGGGRGGGGYDGGGIGAGVFGVTLGTQLGNMMTNAIVAGFQAGTKLMMMPFRAGANALGERLRDEMQDIRTAGGLFSISEVSKQQGKGGLFGTFYDAEKYTKDQNRYLAKLAGSLPGDTQQYINVARQIADGIFRIVTNDEKNAVKTAQILAGARGASPTEMKQFGMGGGSARAAAGKEMVGEMTKLTVLAGMGGRGGQGAHGLPMLIERMFSEQQVSMGMFRRYAAIFGDPMIKNALERNLGKINATTKDTNARFLALQNTLREIVTDDLVERMRKSVSGTIEALRTAFLNPEVGLLGLGRPIMRTVKVFDKFGQQLMNASGQIETDQIAIFDYLRDIFSGIMIPLMPIIDKLPEIFDPFLKLAEALDTMRTEAMFFLKTFNQYKGGLEDIAKNFVGMSDLARETFRGTIPFRAGLSALNNALRRLGAYDLKEFADIAKQLENPNVGVKELGNTLKGMIDKFLGSKAAEKIGYQIGTVVGIVIAQVGELMKAATGTATAGGLAKGFGEGFRAAGGPEGVSNIIRSVFQLFGKLLLEVVKAAPLETAMAAALFFLPGAIAGLVSQALSGGFVRALSRAPSLPTKMPGPRAPGTLGPKGGGFIPALDKLKAPNIIAPIKSAFAYIAQEIRAAFSLLKMGNFGAVFRGLLTPFKAMGGAIKNLPGLFIKGARGLGKFGGVITAVIAAFDVFGALLSGKDIWEALGAAAGPVVGTVIGFALGGPIGAAIGSFIGGLEPVTTFFTGVFKGLGEVFGAVGATIGPIFEGLGTAIMSIIDLGGSLISMFNPFAGAISSATGEIDTMKAIIIATKVILWPVVGAFQLLEQVINLITAGLKGLELAVLYARLGLAQLNPFGNEAAKQKLIDAIRRVEGELAAETDKFAKSFARHSQYYVTEADKAGAAMRNVASSAKEAAKNLKPLSAKEAIAQGKASGLTPTASDMNWYNKATGKPATTPTAANVPAAVPPPAANPVPAIQALNTKQAGTNALLAQINAKTLPGGQVNPIPAIQALNVKQAGANAFLAQLKTQVVTSADGVKKQIGASSNAQQAKIQGVTTAINNLSAKFTAGMPVKVINTPTVKFDMGGVGPVGGGIGGFPKTSGYGMRWGKMHTGNDYGMPVGTKLGIGGPGKVLGAGNWGGYGNAMDIGGPGGMVYRFAHLSKINAPVGANLPPGYPFALSGNTGRSTGPHLHFEARPGGGGPVPPDAFASIIRANFAGTAIGPLMGAMQNEMKGMPYGAQLAVANSDEIFMKPKQMAGVIEGAARAGAEGTGNITTGPITISIDGYNKDPKELTEVIASQLINAMYRKSRSEVLTS